MIRGHVTSAATMDSYRPGPSDPLKHHGETESTGVFGHLARFEDLQLEEHCTFCGGYEFCEIQQGVGGERYSVYLVSCLWWKVLHIKF